MTEMNAMTATAVRITHRFVCNICQRPQRACICQWITPTPHQVEVVILQHPLEVNQAKGTARMLHLSLPLSVLGVGETFDPATLNALLNSPMGGANESPTPQSATPQHTILLYPDTAHDPALGLPKPPALLPETLTDPHQLRLIVLDGTWRKSRKMLYCNPILQQLPRLALHDLPASNYRIRKGHQPHQLSTLEATCAALAQLQGSAAPFAPLLNAFEGFMAQQWGYRTSA